MVYLIFFTAGPTFLVNLGSVISCPLSTTEWIRAYQSIRTSNCGRLPLIFHFIVMLHAWIGMFISVLTAVTLFRQINPVTAANTRHSIKSIAIMNLLLVLHTIAVIIASFTGSEEIDWQTGMALQAEKASTSKNLTLYYLTPLLISASNPLIIFYCCKKLRMFLKARLLRLNESIFETHE